MAKRLKRAFTIVELVIVIAVIAILAAVLIPTFTTLIDKANESNDIALVKNLNTALVSKEATDEVNTMQDALDAAYEYGYTVDKLTPSSSGDIVWDEVNNRFALINEKKEVVFEDGAKPLTSDKAKIWKIVTELKGTQDCSWYVGGLSKEAIEEFTFTMGVDTGSVEADVNYVTAAEQDVTIRTAGGTLTVNAKNATVSHYGTAVKVKITAVAKNSYHEYGEVLGNIELTKGRVVVEDGASASTILVTSATGADIKAEDIIIDVSSNATVGTVAATTAGVITDANTTVPSATDKLTEAVTANSNFAGGIGTEKSPYLIATAEQFYNIEPLYSSVKDGKIYINYNDLYFKQIADLYINKGISYFAGSYDGNGYKIGLDEETISYNGFIVFNHVFGQAEQGIKFSNIDLVQGQYKGAALIGEGMAYYQPGKLTLENINVSSADGKAVRINSERGNFGFLIIGTMFNYSGHECTLTVKDITINANLESEATCTAALLGQGIANVDGEDFDPLYVKFINCVNNANIIGTQSVGFFTANYGQMIKPETITVENCKNNGMISSCGYIEGSNPVNVGSFAGNSVLNTAYDSVVGGKFVKFNELSGVEYEVYQNGTNFSIQTSEPTFEYYIGLSVVALHFGDANGSVQNGRKYNYTLEEISDLTGQTSVKDMTYYAYDKQTAIEKGIITEDTQIEYQNINSKSVGLYVSGNTTYLIFEESDLYYVDSSIQLCLYAHSNDQLVGFIVIK